ncbi:MAG: hypothetical protein AABX01_01640 [Candidatus Micrarchaeota archaeon]
MKKYDAIILAVLMVVLALIILGFFIKEILTPGPTVGYVGGSL